MYLSIFLTGQKCLFMVQTNSDAPYCYATVEHQKTFCLIVNFMHIIKLDKLLLQNFEHLCQKSETKMIYIYYT